MESGHTWAAQTNVAVAANFTDAAKDIAAAFKTKTGNEAVLSFGSSGQLTTQIAQDTPFRAGWCRKICIHRSGRMPSCSRRAPGNPAATAFMAFLKGPEAKAIIERYGYATEDAK